MTTLILIIFVLGYLFIAFEHPFHINKAASALFTGILCWAIYILQVQEVSPHLASAFNEFKGLSGHAHDLHGFIEYRLGHHLYEISNILFFLMGAMTIVEIIDAHEGFDIITNRINTNNKVKLMWILGILTFFFSALLDNLTTTIVMVSLIRKLVDAKEDRWFMASMVVIAANAGGAWSPIGDVTTTMLWIKGQIPSVALLIKNVFLPSAVNLIVPFTIASFMLKGSFKKPESNRGIEHYINPTTPFERKLIFTLGVLALLFVPAFKIVTHLPPFMGMMFSLACLWVVAEFIHKGKSEEIKEPLSVLSILRKIDTSSILFFLGILLAVGALQEIGALSNVAAILKNKLGDITSMNTVIGLLSAIVDNVPIVAAVQGMYEITSEGAYAADGQFWHMLAYAAGTGGSALIIGSAAGVAAMGLEKIDFMWYLKNITWLALLGYFAGMVVMYLFL